MRKANLYQASQQLFRREADERYATLAELLNACQRDRQQSETQWCAPGGLWTVEGSNNRLCLSVDGNPHHLTEWSFSQLCQLARVQKQTVNRLSARTAGHVFGETLPQSRKPMQILTDRDQVRAIHGTAYTRLWNADVLSTVTEFAEGFRPPQEGVTGGTGLYRGEQDMFCFLIDPTGWIEIEGEAFAPGFFVWNSEVGRRSVGIQTFWFQAVCQNHIVWDAVDVSDFSRKHTTNVEEALDAIQNMILQLVERRDSRRDQFVNVLRRAMREKMSDTPEEGVDFLHEHGFRRELATEAVRSATERGALTIFAVIDAFTRLSQKAAFAGQRVERDTAASRLLSLVS